MMIYLMVCMTSDDKRENKKSISMQTIFLDVK
jgi:hypothetical protein